jgi:tetratricopeptide (TPR) repeat protein
MTDADKTVFISYRRSTSKYLARAIFQDLRANGYDAFLDVSTIDSGAFDSIILNQIGARMHFVLLLSPGALERCQEPDDWLRREIQEALRLKRNIVPLIEEGFELDRESTYLPEAWREQFQRLNGMRLLFDYFDEGMERLRSRFLKAPAFTVEIAATPSAERIEVTERIAEVAGQPAPTKEELSAEQYFKRAYVKYEGGDLGGAIADYDEAIRLNPRFAMAYNNRGNMRYKKGDVAGAVGDYDQAIGLNPHQAQAYSNRGSGRATLGDLGGAIADFGEAIRLNPQEATVYSNRAEVYFASKQYERALADFKKANELRPAFNFALAGLAVTHHALGQVQEAKRLWQHLVGQDSRYLDAAWVKQEFNWMPPLVDEAKKLIAKL